MLKKIIDWLFRRPAAPVDAPVAPYKVETPPVEVSAKPKTPTKPKKTTGTKVVANLSSKKKS